MRYIYALILSVFLIGGGTADEPKQAGEPVYDDSGKIFGYVDPAADDPTELECIPEDPNTYPLCFTFGDDGDGEGDDDGDDG